MGSMILKYAASGPKVGLQYFQQEIAGTNTEPAKSLPLLHAILTCKIMKYRYFLSFCKQVIVKKNR